jgi:cell division protein FtsW
VTSRSVPVRARVSPTLDAAKGAARRSPIDWLRPAAAAGRSFLDRPYASLQLILLAGVGLLAFGVMMAASTTISASLQQGSHQTMWSQLTREVEFLVLGVPLFWVAIRLPPRAYRKLAYPILLLGTIALLGVLIPGVGLRINSASRWILIGPVQFQPSEFVKLAILLWGADLLTRKQQFGTLTRARHLFIPLVPVFGLVCAMIMLEPDLGTTMCFLLILLGLLWTVGTPVRYFVAIVALIGAAVTAMAYLEPYRLERLTSFTDPFDTNQHGGYQAVQGLYALASGGVFGYGLGAGPSKYGLLPNANTDYVFAVIGEELGLIGCVVVLALFALFAFTGLRISRRSDDPFTRLAAGGATVYITGQAVINVGYVTGLLPVTGIPLPFISAGGTSLLATALVLGMLVSFARHEPGAVQAARRRVDAGGRSWIERWARIPAPVACAAPERPGRAARVAAAVRDTSASAHAHSPARPAPARPVPVRAAKERAAKERAAKERAAKERAPDARRAHRPTGTEGMRQRHR